MSTRGQTAGLEAGPHSLGSMHEAKEDEESGRGYLKDPEGEGELGARMAMTAVHRAWSHAGAWSWSLKIQESFQAGRQNIQVSI